MYALPMSLCVCHVSALTEEARKKESNPPRAGVTDSCVLSIVGAGTQMDSVEK